MKFVSTKIYFPQKVFQQNAFNKMLSIKCRTINMEKNQESLGYPFFFVGHIVRQQLLDISANYLTNNRGVYIVIELI